MVAAIPAGPQQDEAKAPMHPWLPTVYPPFAGAMSIATGGGAMGLDTRALGSSVAREAATDTGSTRTAITAAASSHSDVGGLGEHPHELRFGTTRDSS